MISDMFQQQITIMFYYSKKNKNSFSKFNKPIPKKEGNYNLIVNTKIKHYF